MVQLKLKDGRSLAYESYGDPNGVPVIFSHGLSDSRFCRHFDDELTKSLGVHIISVDQPGVGGSSNVPLSRRTFQNYAKDIEELADELGLKKFAVAGHSGGGPHAMAIAAHMPDRVTRGVLLAPAPPLDGSVPGIEEAFEKLIPFFGFIMKFVRFFPFLLHGFCVLIAWWAKRNIQGYLEMAADMDRTNHNPETFLGDPRQTSVFHHSFTTGFEQGAAGIHGMLQVVFLNPSWGFSVLDDLPQHFDFFMSDLDAMITPHMGKLVVDAMPKAKLHTFTNAGHYSFCDRECWKQFLSVLKV